MVRHRVGEAIGARHPGQAARLRCRRAVVGWRRTTGQRVRGPGHCPDCRPGAFPRGWGGRAGVPTCATRAAKARRTRPGVRRSAGSGRSQGNRWSATNGRASHNSQNATTTSHVHRSAVSGARGRPVVQPRSCLAKRKPCSTANRRRYHRHNCYRSAGSGPPIHTSHSGAGGWRRRGNRSTCTRPTVSGPSVAVLTCSPPHTAT